MNENADDDKKNILLIVDDETMFSIARYYQVANRKVKKIIPFQEELSTSLSILLRQWQSPFQFSCTRFQFCVHR